MGRHLDIHLMPATSLKCQQGHMQKKNPSNNTNMKIGCFLLKHDS